MGFRIKLNKDTKAFLEQLFKNAPKTYEEALLQGKTPPIPIGKKYKDLKEEHDILMKLFNDHIYNKCNCNSEALCLFKKYENKKITIEEIMDFFK